MKEVRKSPNVGQSAHVADRKHITGLEVDRLLPAVKAARNEARDRCLLLMFGLRVSEACRLKLDQVDPDFRVLHVVRLKRGLCTAHPLRPEELRAIRIDRASHHCALFESTDGVGGPTALGAVVHHAVVHATCGVASFVTST